MRKSVTLALACFLFTGVLIFAGDSEDKKDPWLDPGVYSGLAFRGIGPALMSGRIGDIAVHPRDQSIWYVAVGSGGVWKTVNAGTTWIPVFDSQPSYSIGCVTIDPNFPETIWVGTGENVSGRHVGFGDGVYKSLNGGKTWSNMGLRQSEHIAKILVDPMNSRTILVAAEGPLWSSGGERGLYKSSDGGKTWSRSLNISEDTGITDAVFDPSDSNIIYAAAYQRRRSVAAFMGGGPESGIHKSEDGGESWRRLEVGLPRGHMGKIGLAVSPLDPQVVYATIEAGPREKGFYRSENRGESWDKRNSYTSGGTGPHYYQEIFADPHQFDRVYQMDVWIHVTDDGGRTFHRVPETHKHGDNHALAFDPKDPNYLLSGSDGGLYETWDLGGTWKYAANLPVTQFYKLALDNSLPFYYIHGGTQDNTSQMGPSRTMNINGIRNSDWFITTGADGYACAVDPEDPNVIYAEWQNGSLNRFDRKSGELLNIQPQPGAGEEPYRWNWDAPLIISPHSHTRIYFAAQRLFRSDDRGSSWQVLSPDLTRQIFRYRQPIMGKTWGIDSLWDHGAMSMYSTITSISESPLQEGLIYAGTDDGLIQVTEDGGATWRKVDKISGVPPFYFVNEIRACRHNPDIVFAAVDNHKTGDFRPYLVKSTDRGRTWKLITGDLPERTIVWTLTQDHVQAGLLFIGTEFGIYFTPDGGTHWVKLSGGLPTISFRDLEIQERESDLVGASFGRGFYILDDYSMLRNATKSELSKEAALFPVKKALHYIPSRPLSMRGKAFLGDSIYLAPNPPFGAVFTYYLKDSYLSLAEKRDKDENAAEKSGKPVDFPGWERLREEEREDRPAVILTITDESGRIVKRIEGPASQGIHRLNWDLRYPPVDPIELEGSGEMDPWMSPPVGPLVVPGKFHVSLAKRIDGALISLSDLQPFTVESLGLNQLEEKDRSALLEFQQKAGELQRAMMGAAQAAGEAGRRLRFIKKAVTETPGADPKLYQTALEIEKRLGEIITGFYGDRTVSRRSEAGPPSLMWRVDAQLMSTGPVTATNRKNYEIAAGIFEGLLEDLRRLIETDLPQLEKELETAGAPWTPGRPLPQWKKK